MNKSYKFDGSNTNTYSQYVPQRYIGFKIAMFALLASAVALVVFFVQYI